MEDIILKNMAELGWTPCSEETYPDENNKILIAYWDGEEWCYWMYENCPYGWNVLCRSEAYWRIIREPYRNEM